jgi:hypothetical protein
MQFDLQQLAPSAAAAIAALIMLRAASGKRMVVLRSRSRCAACGRPRSRRGCDCTGEY